MPSKNEEKYYLENSYYHLYNRGVEKRIIFLDQQDNYTFLSYLKVYLLPKDVIKLQEQLMDVKLTSRERDHILKLLRLNNFSDTLELIAFCLMPNHFHFLIFQLEKTTIDQFMNSIMTRYSMYFNKKYKRVGPLFQGVYKAVSVVSDEQLIHLSRYIHQQALKLKGQPLEPQPSSYRNYIGEISQEWVKPDKVLNLFSTGKLSKFDSTLTYRKFVEDFDIDSKGILGKIVLE